MNPEEWRRCKEFGGWFMASSLGRLRRNGSSKIVVGTPNGRGYLTVGFFDRERKQFRQVGVHRVVAAAFHGACPQGKCVNHIDGVKGNNTPANLEYVTPRENAQHASRLGLLSKKYGCKRRRYQWSSHDARVAS